MRRIASGSLIASPYAGDARSHQYRGMPGPRKEQERGPYGCFSKAVGNLVESEDPIMLEEEGDRFPAWGSMHALPPGYPA